MTAEDQDFLDQCAYFWKEKGDMRRFVDFDLERLQRVAPLWHTAFVNYELHQKTLDILVKEFYER